MDKVSYIKYYQLYGGSNGKDSRYFLFSLNISSSNILSIIFTYRNFLFISFYHYNLKSITQVRFQENCNELQTLKSIIFQPFVILSVLHRFLSKIYIYFMVILLSTFYCGMNIIVFTYFVEPIETFFVSFGYTLFEICDNSLRFHLNSFASMSILLSWSRSEDKIHSNKNLCCLWVIYLVVQRSKRKTSITNYLK